MKIVVLLASSFILMLSQCDKETGPDASYNYWIKVDSITHQNSVMLQDTIRIKFYGKIGSTLGDTLQRIDMMQLPDSVTFYLTGYHDNTKSQLKDSYLNGIERKVIPVKRGLLHILVRQPGPDNALRDSIAVY